MKLKLIVYFYLLILIYIMLLIPKVSASDYKIGIQKGDEFIWKCNVCDEKIMEDLFGKDWDENGTGIFEDLKQERHMRYVITDTEKDSQGYSSKTKDNESTLSIEFNKWIWTSKNSWGDRDSKENLYHFKDPDDYSEDFIFPQFAPLWLPLPLGEYLKGVDLDNGYTIDARVLLSITCEIDKDEVDDKYPNKDIKVLALYTEQGILKSYKLYIDDHHVIIDIALQSFISVNISILAIITAIIYFGIIYFIYKKMKF